VGLPIQPTTGSRAPPPLLDSAPSGSGTKRVVSTQVGMIVTAVLKRRA
jgi:hypothetical protein